MGSRSPLESLFHESTLVRPEHWTWLQGVVRCRVLRYFRTQGLLDELEALPVGALVMHAGKS